VKANFAGDVTLSKLNPPHSYVISGQGHRRCRRVRRGRCRGAAGGRRRQTKLIYDVDAKVGGKLAQIGSRLIDSTARRMADDFFKRFAEVVTSEAPVAGKAPEAAAEPAETAKGPAKKTPARKTPAKKAPASKAAATAKKAAAKKAGNGKASRASTRRDRGEHPPEFAAGPDTAHSPSLMPEAAIAASASARKESGQAPQQPLASNNLWWIVGAAVVALLVILVLANA
jgi:cobalamin biosynthesis Mg chelatase CobN